MSRLSINSVRVLVRGLLVHTGSGLLLLHNQREFYTTFEGRRLFSFFFLKKKEATCSSCVERRDRTGCWLFVHFKQSNLLEPHRTQ